MYTLGFPISSHTKHWELPRNLNRKLFKSRARHEILEPARDRAVCGRGCRPSTAGDHEKLMEQETGHAAVHGATKTRTRLRDTTTARRYNRQGPDLSLRASARDKPCEHLSPK